MNFEEILLDVTRQVINGWNSGDFNALSLLLRNDIVVKSAKINLIYPENTSGELIGKENVINYWKDSYKLRQIKLVIESFKKIDQVVHVTLNVEDLTERIIGNFTYDQYGKIKEINLVQS